METTNKLGDKSLAKFSYFKAPIKNTTPLDNVTLFDMYTFIRDVTFAHITEELRAKTNDKEAKQFKANNFDYVTFSGTFSKREDKSLIKHSGLMTIDLDDLSNLEEVKQLLLNDEYFETELLFTSPSGDGLKWIVSIDLTKATHLEYFNGIANYLLKTYQLKVDASGKDVSRACFVPHDRNCYINPKYIENYEERI
ncbi:MAG: virulence protein E [Flavobacteriia bacterium]|nr:virulence protein E [Flavobacteriia bacterium]